MSDDNKLKLHVEALENLFDEKKGIGDDIKDRFALAKGEGYDVKVIKTVLARRALERAAVEEFDQLVVTYEENLA
jgi:uncharacterized protein (UPF0335 family)